MVTWFVVDRAGVSFDELSAFDLSSWTLRPGVLALSCALLAVGYLMTGALWGRIVVDLGGQQRGLGPRLERRLDGLRRRRLVQPGVCASAA